jgi:hypothetical protein
MEFPQTKREWLVFVLALGLVLVIEAAHKEIDHLSRRLVSRLRR